MNKISKYVIENVEYTINIMDNIAKIYDNNGNQISDNIKIAECYVKDDKIVEALVISQVKCFKQEQEVAHLREDALKKLGITI